MLRLATPNDIPKDPILVWDAALSQTNGLRGLKPTHAHVTDRDQAFVLLGYYRTPATTVTITSPA